MKKKINKLYTFLWKPTYKVCKHSFLTWNTLTLWLLLEIPKIFGSAKVQSRRNSIGFRYFQLLQFPSYIHLAQILLNKISACGKVKIIFLHWGKFQNLISKESELTTLISLADFCRHHFVHIFGNILLLCAFAHKNLIYELLFLSNEYVCGEKMVMVVNAKMGGFTFLVECLMNAIANLKE